MHGKNQFTKTGKGKRLIKGKPCRRRSQDLKKESESETGVKNHCTAKGDDCEGARGKEGGDI